MKKLFLILSVIAIMAFASCEHPDDIICYQRFQSDSLFVTSEYTDHIIFIHHAMQIDTICTDEVPQAKTFVTQEKTENHGTMIHKYDIWYE